MENRAPALWVVVARGLLQRRWDARLVVLLTVFLVPHQALGALPYPSELRPQVEFWKKIFAHYSRNQVVIHDAWRLERIYSVLDFSGEAQDLETDLLPAYVEIRVNQEKERIRSLLLRLHQNNGQAAAWNGEEQRIVALFREDRDPDKFLRAADPKQIRAQRGLREKFIDGLRISGRYLPTMEAIFRAEGLPVELTRLPLVESCFNVRAYSKAGAAGIWQFMPSTARLFLRVDDTIDERRDPIESTKAAAKFLKRNYEKLGTWPLAVTAYNHGPAGVQRAVKAVGSRDIVAIIRRYQGPGFGFASRNFYAELLAALEVDREAERYFGRLERLRPLQTELVHLPESAPFAALATMAGLTTTELAELNPALMPRVVQGQVPVPAGFRLNLPVAKRRLFEERYAAWRARKTQEKLVAGRPIKERLAEKRFGGEGAQSAVRAKRKHRVRRGQTLTMIARLYGLSVSDLERENRLRRGTRLRPGQVLVIPEG